MSNGTTMENELTMTLSVIIPVFNEQESLPQLLEQLRSVLEEIDGEHEILFVDDGSSDNSLAWLRQEAEFDSRIKVLSFSRNFGHQAAVTAGLDFARGAAAVVMDADLQDPPELLPEMLSLVRQGYDVVSAQRTSREGETLFKRVTASWFYWLMRKAVDPRMVPEVGDFRMFSYAAVRSLRRFREQHRFMRGLVAWLGLKEIVIPFHRQPRFAGSTKYPLTSMIRFAWTGISSFSALPLRLTLGAGLLLSAASVSYLIYVVYATLVLKITVPGWSSLVCIQILSSGAILTSIGLVGDYVARLFDEAKRRPLYVVNDAVNFEHPPEHLERALYLARAQPKAVEAAALS